ncbi:MAG: hypothetical protein R3E91_01375 [Chlamydiales bacterium]
MEIARNFSMVNDTNSAGPFQSIEQSYLLEQLIAQQEGRFGFLYANGGDFYTCSEETKTWGVPEKIHGYLLDKQLLKDQKKSDIEQKKFSNFTTQDSISQKSYDMKMASQSFKNRDQALFSTHHTTRKTDTTTRKIFRSLFAYYNKIKQLSLSKLTFFSHNKPLLEKDILKNQIHRNDQVQSKQKPITDQDQASKNTIDYHKKNKSDHQKEVIKEHHSEKDFNQDNRKKRHNQEEMEVGEDLNKNVENKHLDHLHSKEVLTYLSQESKLFSELYKMRVSHFDILLLFIKVIELSLKGREQERHARMEERRLQISHIRNMVNEFKKEAQYSLYANLGAGFLAFGSGLCPILGHMKGDTIINTLSHAFSSLRGIEKDKFIEGVTKMTFSMSEMSKGMGQVQTTFAAGSRNFSQCMSDIHKADWEEYTRSMDELKDYFKNCESFIYETLRSNHDVIKHLYGAG